MVDQMRTKFFWMHFALTVPTLVAIGYRGINSAGLGHIDGQMFHTRKDISPQKRSTHIGMSAPLTVKNPTRIVRGAAASLYSSKLRRDLGWILEYADLRINGTGSEWTTGGLLFLSTNLVFAAAGASFSSVGNAPMLGALCDLAGVFSTWYHWEQCRLGGTKHPLVQLAMLFDYSVALPTIVAGTAYAVALGPSLPWTAVLFAALALVSLVAGWFCDSPHKYMLVHGLWHVFGAASGIELAFAYQPVDLLIPP